MQTTDRVDARAAEVPGREEWLTGAFPELGTEEWGRMNIYRFSLIQRKVAGTATPGELAELEILQERAWQAATRKSPLPPSPFLAGSDE